MKLDEFIADQKQLLDDFSWQYNERRKKGREHTLFRPEQQWVDLLTEFLKYRREVLTDEAA